MTDITTRTLPCPWCGSKAIRLVSSTKKAGWEHYLQCSHCLSYNAAAKKFTQYSAGEAEINAAYEYILKKWNTRA